MRSLASIFLLVSILFSVTILAEGTRLKGPKNVDYGKQGRSIGPVRQTDTLWRIAMKVRPDNSISIYQVMRALYEKNPQSFLDKNINHLRTGSYLRIPSILEFRSIEPELAKQKSDYDDSLWEKKKQGKLTKSEIDLVEKKVTQAKKSDVDAAKNELKIQLNEIQKDQRQKLADLKEKFKQSVESSKVILNENEKLQSQLKAISKELNLAKEERLGNDTKTQQKIDELFELLRQQKQAEMERNKGINWSEILSNPLYIALFSSIPAIFIIGGVVVFLRNRKKGKASADISFDKPVAVVPPPPPFEATPADLASESELNESFKEDLLDDDLLAEDSIQLDGTLDDDILPESDEILYEEDETI